MDTMTNIPIAQILQTRGLRPSPQRLAVYKYLCSVKTHPSVDTIYNELIKEYPTLSRTTVYQTLEALYNCGLIQRFSDEGEMRFDADTVTHGHFKCIGCGNISDIFWPKETALPKPQDDHLIHETLLFYRGLCPVCRKSSDKLLASRR